MGKEAKSIKSATLPLPWLDFRGGGGEMKREIIEALAHDLGKASQGRFGDHAEASAELLKKAGFSDKTVLHLIGKHHKSLSSCDSEPNLHMLQLADRLAASQRADGGTSNAFIQILDYNYLRLTEAYLLHDLSEHRLKFGDDYNKPVSDEKLGDVVIKMHSEGFEIDGIAYQTGLPQLHNTFSFFQKENLC